MAANATLYVMSSEARFVGSQLDRRGFLRASAALAVAGCVPGIPAEERSSASSSTFAPNGDRSVFDRRFFLLETPLAQPRNATLSDDLVFP